MEHQGNEGENRKLMPHRNKILLGSFLIISIFCAVSFPSFFSLRNQIMEDKTSDLNQYYNVNMNSKYQKRLALGFDENYSILSKYIENIDILLDNPLREVWNNIGKIEKNMAMFIADENYIAPKIDVFVKKSITQLKADLIKRSWQIMIILNLLIISLIVVTLLWNRQHRITKNLNILKDNLKRKNDDLMGANILAENNRRYFKSLFEQSTLAIQIFDTTGTTIDVNQCWQDIWETPASKVIGKYNILKDDRQEEELWLSLIKEVFKGETKNLPDREFLFPKGKSSCKKIIKCQAFPIIIDGIIKRVVLLQQDITARKQSELEKEKLKEELSHNRRLDSIGQLAGGVAHDFNNMLTGIIGSAQLLQAQERKLDTAGLQYVDLILMASSQAADLTSKLLAFGTKGRIISTEMDIHQIIDDTVKLLTKTIDRKISVKVLPAAKNSIILGDRTSIQNALLNMGINASHAMKEGGTLSFETENIELDDEFCNSSAFDITAGDYLKISIIDTGCGMNHDILDQIFEPFFTTRERNKGTGLGLSAVYGMIKDHQGAIQVSSELNRGSVFKLYIPSSVLNENKAKGKESKGIASGNGRILFIDNEDVVRITGTMILENIGYHVIAFKDGEKALELFEKQHDNIDLVISNMGMAQIDGHEFFHKLKKIDEGCKIILTSGLIRENDLNDLKKEGLDGFIEKPFTNEEISRLISRVLKPLEDL
ncbi:MAG: hypothetical protein B6241_01255 [Spirochaetaceae bacterium 4572_59]|nr:MAG: hypothetical protein B6241_01255 [Spirochaetaceae bacterium 4572_59]